MVRPPGGRSAGSCAVLFEGGGRKHSSKMAVHNYRIVRYISRCLHISIGRGNIVSAPLRTRSLLLSICACSPTPLRIRPYNGRKSSSRIHNAVDRSLLFFRAFSARSPHILRTFLPYSQQIRSDHATPTHTHTKIAIMSKRARVSDDDNNEKIGLLCEAFSSSGGRGAALAKLMEINAKGSCNQV